MGGALFFSWLGHRSGLEYPFWVAGALLIANAAIGVFALPQEARHAGTGSIRPPDAIASGRYRSQIAQRAVACAVNENRKIL